MCSLSPVFRRVDNEHGMNWASLPRDLEMEVFISSHVKSSVFTLRSFLPQKHIFFFIWKRQKHVLPQGLGWVAGYSLRLPLFLRTLLRRWLDSEQQKIIWFTSRKCPLLQLLSFLLARSSDSFLLLISVSFCVLSVECPHHTLPGTKALRPPQTLSRRSPPGGRVLQEPAPPSVLFPGALCPGIWLSLLVQRAWG